MDKDFKFYLQRIDGSIPYAIVDVEKEFPNLKYLSLKGLNTIGKTKNIYTEDYSEAKSLRVYIPKDSELANSSTDVTLVVLIFGENIIRQQTLDAFVEYIKPGIHRYYDNVRQRSFDFIVVDDISVSDEKLYGDNPYIEVSLKLKNINGNSILKK